MCDSADYGFSVLSMTLTLLSFIDFGIFLLIRSVNLNEVTLMNASFLNYKFEFSYLYKYI